MGWIHGDPFAITKSWVYAKDNDNRTWAVVLASARAFPVEFGSDLAGAHVDIAGEAHSLSGVGGDPTQSIFEFATDRAGAESIAKKLGIEAKPRVDPKLVLGTGLTMSRSGARAITAQFLLENRGTLPFSFLAAGHRASPGLSDPEFELEIERDGVLLPTRTPPVNLGGMREVVTLAPDETHAFDFELAEWASIDAPGSYRVRAFCRFEVQAPPTAGGIGYDTAWMHWAQTAQAQAEFRVD